MPRQPIKSIKEAIIQEFDNPQSINPGNIPDNVPNNISGNKAHNIQSNINGLTEEYSRQNEPKRAVEPSKRLVALLIDLVTCYILSILISVIVSLIPLLPNLLPQPMILVVIFMSRDYFFGGRGIGKNLMGLQVVDASSGKAVTLRQSFLRNVTLAAPLIVLGLAAMVPAAILPPLITDIIDILAKIYSFVVLPLESYRAFTREDSLRLGDQLAHTKIVQTQTSFDQFVPKNKN